MKLPFGAAAFLVSILLYFSPSIVSAQVLTAGPDSAQLPLAVDTAGAKKGFFLSTWDKPSKAALLSAIVPGAGQVYNNAYWKVPIIYATGAVLGYFLIDNNNKYQDFRQALIQRNRDSTDIYVTSRIYGVYNPSIGVLTQRGTENLRYSRDFYRRNRDLTILISVLAYGLNVAEAYVHAHLKEFDISEDLSLRVQPDFIPVKGSNYTLAPGLTFVLYTSSK